MDIFQWTLSILGDIISPSFKYIDIIREENDQYFQLYNFGKSHYRFKKSMQTDKHMHKI